jgi:uncharacterized protein
MSEAVLRGSAIAYAPPRAEEAVGEPPGPVRPKERIQIIDVLRGFALFGILQVNWPDWEGSLGRVLDFLVDDKMRTIYSLLFGIGFGIQLIRAQEKGRPFLVRYAWRALLLLVIGGAHFVLIWSGDIVRFYALMSFLLLLFARARPSVLIVAAALSLALDVTPNLPGKRNQPFLTRANPELADRQQVDQQNLQEHRATYAAKAIAGDNGEGYRQLVRARWFQLREQLSERSIYLFANDLQLLSLFLVGLFVAKKRILHEPERHRRLLRWTLIVGLSVGLFANLYNGFGDIIEARHVPLLSLIPMDGIGGNIAYEVGNYFLAMGYVAGVTLLVLNFDRVRSAAAAMLAPVGRMGLTNYLMQSVILTLLLDGRGLGLGPSLPTWWRQLVLEIVFVVQIAYSRWWFEHFQYGPVEWAWRSLTWFRLQPMKVVPERKEAVA